MPELEFRSLYSPCDPNSFDFKQDIQRLIEDIAVALPKAFESEEYQSRLHELEGEFQSRPAKHFDDLRAKAKARSIAMLQTPMGFAFAPLKKEEVLPVEEFEKFAAEERARITAEVEELQEDLQKILRQLGRWQKELREKLRELNREAASFAIGHLMDEVAARYQAHASVQTYFNDIRSDISEHAKEFLQLHEGQRSGQGSPASISDRPALRRYGINVLVDNGRLEGAPVLYEDHPTYENLIGRIEHIAQMGALITDFNLVQTSALEQVKRQVRGVKIIPVDSDGLLDSIRKSGSRTIVIPSAALSRFRELTSFLDERDLSVFLMK